MLPDESSGFGVQTAKLSRHPKRVHPTIIPGWRCAWTITPHAFSEVRIPSVSPEFTPCCDIVASHDLPASPLLDGERPAVGDNKGRIAAADRLVPPHRQSIGGPGGQNVTFVIASITIWSTEIGPIGAVFIPTIRAAGFPCLILGLYSVPLSRSGRARLQSPRRSTRPRLRRP